jgi:hypothetical protein
MEDNTSTPKEKFSYSSELANQILEIQNEIMDLATKKGWDYQTLSKAIDSINDLLRRSLVKR